MAQQAAIPIAISYHQSEFRRVLSVLFRRKVAMLGAIIIVTLVVVAIFAPLLAPHDPYKVNLDVRLQAPNSTNLLGTDSFGRDVLSRLIYGAQTSLTIGIFATLISLIVGSLLGLTAAYFGGIVYTIIMRFIDALMSIPPLILILLVSAALGNGMKNIIVALGIGMISEYCRITCGQALSIKNNDYITAQYVAGSGDFRIMLRHILPNCMAPIIVLTTVQMGMVILSEASLSFLGFGIVEPQAAWGSMLNDGYKYMLSQPLLSFIPGIAIMLVVFGFNMLGDGLRDALDPRLRGTL